MTLLHVLPILLPVAAVALIALQGRRERAIRRRRLWIAPVLFSALVATALAVVPHPPFAPSAYGAMVAAAASGLYFGLWRAHVAVLRHVPGTGRLMIRQSNAAVAVLAGVFLLRTVVRSLGPQAALTTDLSMLFALGMIVAFHVALWRRSQGMAV